MSSLRVLLSCFLMLLIPTLVVGQATNPGACMTFCHLQCSEACDTSHMYMCGSSWCGCACTSADNLPGNQTKNVGTIIGIVFGCIAGVAFLIAIGFFCVFRRSTYYTNRRYVATTTLIVAETKTPVVQNINVVNHVPTQVTQPMPLVDVYGQPMYAQQPMYTQQAYQPPHPAYAQSTPVYQQPYQPQQAPPAYTV